MFHDERKKFGSLKKENIVSGGTNILNVCKNVEKFFVAKNTPP